VCARNNPEIPPKRPLLCYVTDRNTLIDRDDDNSVELLLRKVDEVISAGIDWVQVREKDLSAKELSRITRAALRRAAKISPPPISSRILVNDRLDLALAEGAGGVHLGGKSLSVKDAKALVRRVAPARMESEEFLVGVSCHSREEAEAAEVSGADYIFFGPIFATPSKAAFGAPQGLDRLAEVCRAMTIPVLAIGGITLNNAKSCLAAGASGLAAIRLFQDALNPVEAIDTLHQLPCTRPSE
jgi:thiamine-phosphate pyrophosphorylase